MFSQLNTNDLDYYPEDKSTWYWIADYCEIDQDGRVKYFSNGKEIAYPWILVND